MSREDRGQREAPNRAALYESLVEDAFEFIVVISDDLTVEFVSRPVTHLLGVGPAELVGRSVAEHIHPDDVDRALFHLAGWQQLTPGGTTSFRVRVRPADPWQMFDVTAATVTDGARSLFAVYCRPADYQHATDEVLARLLGGEGRAAALSPVLDVFAWKVNGSHVAISWYEEGSGHHSVSTGLPADLTGAGDQPGVAWIDARQSFTEVVHLDRSHLEPRLARLAEDQGCAAYWIVPVADAGSGIPALITIWVQDDVHPGSHAFGMSVAQRYVEVILRWSSHVAALNAAARRDPLTELANRVALFEALDQGRYGGALLFCDLDRFKPINDAHGHAAGDEVLRRIGARLGGSIRATDLVARTGGDEFVVVAPATSPEQAEALAQRIVAAVGDPITVGGAEVRVGVTIGVAHEPGRLTEATLARADRALMAAKADGRPGVVWADPA